MTTPTPLTPTLTTNGSLSHSINHTSLLPAMHGESVVVACPECSSSHPLDLLADHLRGHWQTRVDQLEARIKQFEQQQPSPEMKLQPEAAASKAADISAASVEVDSMDEDMDVSEDEKVDDEAIEEDEGMNEMEEEDENDYGVDGSTGNLNQLMDSATDTARPPPSHFTPVPSEMLFEDDDPDGVEAANELINNPDSREGILEDVLDQLDHVPESLRTVLEELLVQHNADEYHPLKYCSVEEFHSMVDSHLHPSGGGEFEYVGKLVQQLESALKLSQQELSKYMKTNELDFNEMGPFMIEQKRIKEELIKQRAILFPLESPLWQACINYLREELTEYDIPLESPLVDTLKPSLRPPSDSTSTAGAAETMAGTSEVMMHAASTTGSTTDSNIITGISGLDGVSTVAVDGPQSIASAPDPYILPEFAMDEDEVVDELLDEAAEGRYGRYQWMCDSIEAYKHVVKRRLVWGEVFTFLVETNFIGSEVKETIQFLFTQPNFMLNADANSGHAVIYWSGWNFINISSDDYSPLDSSLPLNRKLLRGLDALIDCIIELMDIALDAEDELEDEDDRMKLVGQALMKLTPSNAKNNSSNNHFHSRVDAFLRDIDRRYVGWNYAPTSITDEINHQTRQQLTKLVDEAKDILKSDTDGSAQERVMKEDMLLRLRAHLELERTDTIIPRENMELLIREVLQSDWRYHRNYCIDDFTPEAIDALHIAAEDYLISQFASSGLEMYSMCNLIYGLTCGLCHRYISHTNETKYYQCLQCTSPEFYKCQRCHDTPPPVPSSSASAPGTAYTPATNSTAALSSSHPPSAASSSSLSPPHHPSHTFQLVVARIDPSTEVPLATLGGLRVWMGMRDPQQAQRDYL